MKLVHHVHAGVSRKMEGCCLPSFSHILLPSSSSALCLSGIGPSRSAHLLPDYSSHHTEFPEPGSIPFSMRLPLPDCRSRKKDQSLGRTTEVHRWAGK
jgi:hypothetical protein